MKVSARRKLADVAKRCTIWDFNAFCETENEFITDLSTAASMVNAMAEMPSWFISSIWSFVILLNGDATNTTTSFCLSLLTF